MEENDSLGRGGGGATVNGKSVFDPVSKTTDLNADAAIIISPNPNAGFFTIDLPRPAAHGMAFCVADLTGRPLMEQKAEAGARQQTVRAGWLPPGLYFVQVVLDGKVVVVEKLVKQ